MQFSRLSADRNFYMRRKFHDDLDVQELIHCQCQYMSSHQDMKYEARFRRCMRRCVVENRKRVNRKIEKYYVRYNYVRYKMYNQNFIKIE